MVFTMANVGLPGTSGFVGEFLTLLGAFRANPGSRSSRPPASSCRPAYALWLYRRVIYGTLEKPELQDIADLDRREMVILAPLVALSIYYGVQPGPILDAFAASDRGADEELSRPRSRPCKTAAPGRSHAEASTDEPRLIVMPAFGPGPARDHPRGRRARCWSCSAPSGASARRTPSTIGALALLVARADRRRCSLPAARSTTFSGAFVVDGFARFMKVADADRRPAAAILLSLRLLAARAASTGSSTRS